MGLYLGGDFMAVPAEVRAVPRPVNTVIDDNGKDSPKRYAVRQRGGSVDASQRIRQL